ncbi:hypothetical protein [Nocardia sp. CA-145437]|uniref:hypothetical protein n=1 Tax=Nocardia sp. CA-145437 TaxID=3239980 RepID=UPI003D975246
MVHALSADPVVTSIIGLARRQPQLRIEKTSWAGIDIRVHAHAELGWSPRYSSVEALLEVLGRIRAAAEIDTPPLSRTAGGPLRIHEFTSGIDARDPVDRAPVPRTGNIRPGDTILDETPRRTRK